MGGNELDVQLRADPSPVDPAFPTAGQPLALALDYLSCMITITLDWAIAFVRKRIRIRSIYDLKYRYIILYVYILR